MNELKKCPFCGCKCDVVTGIGGITFFHCINDNCSATISFKFAESLKPASKSNECCARCQMLEVDNARLKKLIATMEIRN